MCQEHGFSGEASAARTVIYPRKLHRALGPRRVGGKPRPPPAIRASDQVPRWAGSAFSSPGRGAWPWAPPQALGLAPPGRQGMARHPENICAGRPRPRWQDGLTFSPEGSRVAVVTYK